MLTPPTEPAQAGCEYPSLNKTNEILTGFTITLVSFFKKRGNVCQVAELFDLMSCAKLSDFTVGRKK